MGSDKLAVIFDMDGVLIDSYAAHLRSWVAMGREFGLEITERQFAASFGRTSRDIIARLWGEGLSDQRIAVMDARKEAIYREIIAADFPAMDGAGEFVDTLTAAGFLLAIGSSGPPENVAAVVAGLARADGFAATVNGMDVSRGKPDPEVFLTAAGKLGVEPRRCAVVEDAPAGVEAARRAGMAAIALTGTAQREDLAGADLVVDSLRELSPKIVADLIARRAS